MGRGPRCKVPNEVQHAGEGFKVQNPKHTIQMGDGQRSGVQHVWEVFKVQGRRCLRCNMCKGGSWHKVQHGMGGAGQEG